MGYTAFYMAKSNFGFDHQRSSKHVEYPFCFTEVGTSFRSESFIYFSKHAMFQITSLLPEINAVGKKEN